MPMKQSDTALPVIDVAQPCPKDWDQMSGDDRRRFCAHCQRFVHNLSAMSRTEVEDLICAEAGRLCVRFERDDSGGVKTLDYATRSGGRSRRWLLVGCIIAGIAAIAQAAWHRRPRATPPVVLGSLVVQGDVSGGNAGGTTVCVTPQGDQAGGAEGSAKK